MDYQKARTTGTILFIIGAALFLSLFLFTESKIFNIVLPIIFILALGAISAGVIIMVKYYRCPHCHNRILVRGPAPDYCPRCGEAL